MRRLLGILTFTAIVAAAWTSLAFAAEPKLPDVAEGNAAFATELYQQLKTGDGNLFLSPYSISSALAMTYAGARGNTAAQMAKTLHFAADPKELHPAFAKLQAALDKVQKKGNVKLAVANSLWPQKDYVFLPDYVALCKKYYGVTITPVDYKADAEAARKVINGWVEEKTQKRIKDLIPAGMLDDTIRLVLTNAIYFKGKWAAPFDAKLTQAAPFTLATGKTVQTPMMTRQTDFGYGEFDKLQVLEMPYAGKEVSMVVLLPKDKNGLADLEKNLTPENLRTWTQGLAEIEVLAFVPKFKTTAQFDLVGALKTMGMPDAVTFGPADFSGMDGSRMLFIGHVLHKAFVEVNEEGTEAAGSTAVVMGMGGIPAPPPTFRADHPFLFLIRENKTGSILFLGRLSDPTKAE